MLAIGYRSVLLACLAAGCSEMASAPPFSLSVQPASTNITAGQTVQLTATPQGAAGSTLPHRTITWASDASSVATVSDRG